MLSEMESFWRVVSRGAIRSLQLQERRHGKEATALILERNDDDLGHGSAAEISKKWSDSEYILRVQPTDFQTDHMWVLKGRGVKDISKLLAWASGRKELLTFKIRGFNLIIQTSSFFHNTRKRGQLYICIFNKTEVIWSWEAAAPWRQDMAHWCAYCLRPGPVGKKQLFVSAWLLAAGSLSLGPWSKVFS